MHWIQDQMHFFIDFNPILHATLVIAKGFPSVNNLAFGVNHLPNTMTHLWNQFWNILQYRNPAWGKPFKIGLIIVGGYIMARTVMILVDNYRKISISKSEDPRSEQNSKRVKTICAILKNTTLVTIFITAAMMLLSEVGINMAPLLAGAGIAGIAIGFGAQNLVKDLFYGFFILFENQFSIGDVVQIGSATGEVERMTLRAVRVRDLDGRVHIIPNSDANKVIVFTKDWARMNINLEVAYETNLDQAFEVIDTVNRAFFKKFKTVLMETPQNLGVEELGSNGIVIKVIAKTIPHKQWELSRHYRKAIKEAFDSAEIDIPFPQRTLHIKNATLPKEQEQFSL